MWNLKIGFLGGRGITTGFRDSGNKRKRRQLPVITTYRDRAP